VHAVAATAAILLDSELGGAWSSKAGSNERSRRAPNAFGFLKDWPAR
jgi:hypothetical protein